MTQFLSKIRIATAVLVLMSLFTVESTVANVRKFATTEHTAIPTSLEQIWKQGHPGAKLPTTKTMYTPFEREMSKAAPEMYTVDLNITDNHAENVFTDCVFAYDSENMVNYYGALFFEGEQLWPLTVPQGTYDIVFFINNYSAEDGKGGIHVIIKENVYVDSDTEIAADYTHVSDRIHFKNLLPNGEEVQGETYKQGAIGNWELDNPGNVRSATFFSWIVYKGYPIYSLTSDFTNNIYSDGTEASNRYYGDIWFTPNDNLEFYQVTMVTRQEEGNSFIVIGTDPTISQTAANNISNYYSPIECKFAQTAASCLPDTDSDIETQCGFAGFTQFYNDLFLFAYDEGGHGGMEYADNIATYCPDPKWAPNVSVKPQLKGISVAKFEVQGGIIAPTYNFESNKWEVFHQNDSFSGNYCLFSSQKEEELGITSYAFHPRFSFDNDRVFEFGFSTPIVSLLRDENQFGYSFVGRYGEVRTIDLFNHQLSFKVDGTEVCNSYWDLENYFWSEDAQTSADWNINILDENLTIDGLNATTTFEMQFSSGHPYSNPSLMQLQLKNKDGEITDKFNDGNDGDINFAAGNFLYTVDEYWNSWFSYEPLKEILVEFAPYGSDNYSSLEVQCIEDNFFMPGYGAFYSVALSQIDRTSDTKWYDLRITLISEDGNYQKQTISPCFRIETVTPSGVGEILSYEAKADVWTINGSLVASGMTASQIATLPRGIYLLKANERYSKIAIR